MRIDRITVQQVHLAPKPLEPSVLYVSEKYRVAMHLCCCGCGEKVVTPLSPAEWQLELIDGVATLEPSIGNASACRSHYWIRRNRVEWAPKMTSAHIAYVQERDRESLAAMYESKRQRSGTTTLLNKIRSVFQSLWDWIRR